MNSKTKEKYKNTQMKPIFSEATFVIFCIKSRPQYSQVINAQSPEHQAIDSEDKITGSKLRPKLNSKKCTEPRIIPMQ